MVLSTRFGGIHPNGSNNSMFLFKSHIQQHLSASISEFLNFPGFWVTSESRESICRTILAWLFILFNIKSRFLSICYEVSAHDGPLCLKSLLTPLIFHISEQNVTFWGKPSLTLPALTSSVSWVSVLIIFWTFLSLHWSGCSYVYFYKYLMSVCPSRCKLHGTKSVLDHCSQCLAHSIW